MWYAGWDGGGTKTEVCVLNDAGEIMTGESFGPLNPNGSSREQVMRTIHDAMDWMKTLPGGLDACGRLVVGSAGINNRDTAVMLKEGIREAGWRKDYLLTGDQDIALYGAVSGTGAILIAGTGAICCGRTPEGKKFRVGGNGHLIDDEGSGYAIGRDILAAVIRAFDGRIEPTVLGGMVTETLKVPPDDIQGIITWLYSPKTGKKEIASLARLLPDALRQHDAAAFRIAGKAAEELSALVIAGWKKNGMTEGELAMAGSILQKVPAIRNLVEAQIHAYFPNIQMISPRHSPAFGAASMARENVSE